MSWFVETETYKRDITDPLSGETSWVELRPLNSGDRAMLEDALRMQAEDASVDVKLGTLRLLTVERAVTNWGLPLSPTRSTIEALNPEVFEQIYNLCSFGVAPEEQGEDANLDEDDS